MLDLDTVTQHCVANTNPRLDIELGTFRADFVVG
jgi:hypothetical protein